MRDVEVEALRKIADLQPCGRATRVRLRDGGRLDELEAALLPVLPVRFTKSPTMA